MEDTAPTSQVFYKTSSSKGHFRRAALCSFRPDLIRTPFFLLFQANIIRRSLPLMLFFDIDHSTFEFRTSSGLLSCSLYSVHCPFVHPLGFRLKKCSFHHNLHFFSCIIQNFVVPLHASCVRNKNSNMISLAPTA